jgi:hypothetical protein
MMNKFILKMLGFEPVVIAALEFGSSLSLILQSIAAGSNPNVAPFARRVFAAIPGKFKDPVGPATEQEFVDAVYALFALFVKQK